MLRHLSQLRHVGACVTALRWLLPMHARPDRSAEAARLRVLVVHVVLAVHAVAGELEQAAHRVSKHHTAPVTDVHRAGGVDAPELHLDALAVSGVGRAISLAAGGDLRDQALQPMVCQPEVDVAGDRLDRGRRLGHRNDRGHTLGDLVRTLAQRPGQLSAGRAGVVPELGILGAAELEVGHLALDP